jgi:hypothetical protein
MEHKFENDFCVGMALQVNPSAFKESATFIHKLYDGQLRAWQ